MGNGTSGEISLDQIGILVPMTNETICRDLVNECVELTLNAVEIESSRLEAPAFYDIHVLNPTTESNYYFCKLCKYSCSFLPAFKRHMEFSTIHEDNVFAYEISAKTAIIEEFCEMEKSKPQSKWKRSIMKVIAQRTVSQVTLRKLYVKINVVTS